MATRKYTLHVISHTHWDREWYQEFQSFRRRLVYQMDRLLDLLDQYPDFRCFHLEGQTACVLDYLEMRPGNRRRLLRRLRQGRVLIGPFFVMSDEFLVSGESLVRNLLLGRRICRSLGVEPMPSGYVTDTFGHCSQLPQILRGFGIDNAVLVRGTPGKGEQSELVWEGADGSVVLVIRLPPDGGYGEFLRLRRMTDAEAIREDERQRLARATTRVLFAFDGGDHEPARADIAKQMQRLERTFRYTRCVQAALPELVRALWRTMGPDWQKGRRRYRGELRSPARIGSVGTNGLFPNAASSRAPLKQANDEQEWRLARCAEPLHTWAVLLGGDNQREFLDLSWKYLLLNHAHDSIGGGSCDQVHRDMLYRFDQSRALAVQSIRESMQDICDRLDSARLGAGDTVVTAFNCAAAPSGPVTRLLIELPVEEVAQKRQEGQVPVLLNEQDQPVYAEVEHIEHRVAAAETVRKQDPGGPAAGYYFHWGTLNRRYERFHLNAACSLPALAYATWRIGYRSVADPVVPPASVQPVRVQARSRSLENAWLRVRIRRDGRLDLYDKATRCWYRGLHVFEDSGDAGTGYEHRYPEGDRPILSSDPAVRRQVEVSFEQTGRLSAIGVIRLALRMPEGLTPGNWQDLPPGPTRRSARKTTLWVTTRLTLTAGARRLDCRTSVSNTARCHRLRVLFPTHLRCHHWFGDTAFDWVRRMVRLRDTTGWVEPMREEAPVKNWVAACGRRRGLALLTRGLHEACVRDDRERTIALTLFRSFTHNPTFGWTQDSLLLGELTLEYALVPFTATAGKPPAALCQEVERYKVPVVAHSKAPGKGNLPPHGYLFAIRGPLALAAIKLGEAREHVVLRLYNPLTQPVAATVRAGCPCSGVARIDLCETVSRALKTKPDGTVRLLVSPKAIVTLCFRPRRAAPARSHGAGRKEVPT